jgi:hypothetical protein
MVLLHSSLFRSAWHPAGAGCAVLECIVWGRLHQIRSGADRGLSAIADEDVAAEEREYPLCPRGSALFNS